MDVWIEIHSRRVQVCGSVSTFLTPLNIPSVAPNSAAGAEQVPFVQAQVEKDFDKIYIEITSKYLGQKKPQGNLYDW